MANLWIFGDSFSASNQTLISSNSLQSKYIQNYISQNSSSPTHFSDLLQKTFNIKRVHNYAFPGYTNDAIVESIGNQISEILPEDYVCVSWTNINRFRLILNNEWLNLNIFHNKEQKESVNLIFNSIFKTGGIDKLIVERNCWSVISELYSWQKILKVALPSKTLFWSPFTDFTTDKFYLIPSNYNIERIEESSDIPDKHYSHKGNEQLGRLLINWFENLDML